MTKPTVLLSRHVYHPSHGPQVWPWWRLVSVALVRQERLVPKGVTGYNLWVYTRWGALCTEIAFDRRRKPLPVKGQHAAA